MRAGAETGKSRAVFWRRLSHPNPSSMNMMVGESFFSPASSTLPASGQRRDPAPPPAAAIGRRPGTSPDRHTVAATLSSAAAILSKMSATGTNASAVPAMTENSSSLQPDSIRLPLWNMGPVPVPPAVPCSLPSTSPTASPSSSPSPSSSSSSLPSVLSLAALSSLAGISNHNQSSHSQSSSNSSASSTSSMDIYTCQVSVVPRVVFVPLPNSHMFEERSVEAGSPVKIGRAVARFKPAANNAIFDCKVLSRNHALLWFENGRFFIQDTKSSNGTFVNNRRLSVASEESTPLLVTSGDVVQFGVDVVENQKRVTHGCIIATLRLFLPGGQEVPAGDTAGSSHTVDGDVPNNNNNAPDQQSSHADPTVISTNQLLQLSHCLKDALSREDFLEKKILILEQVLSKAIESADSGWKSLVQEDALLSKIESLQSKLESVLKSLSAKTMDEETGHLRNEVLRLHTERDEYESAAKMTIINEKERCLQSDSKIHALEANLQSANNEVESLKLKIEKMESDLKAMSVSYDSCKEELQEVTTRHSRCEQEIAKLTAAGEQHPVDLKLKNELQQELNDTKAKLDEALNEVTRLRDQIREHEEKEETILLQATAKTDSEEQELEIERLRQSVEELMNQLNCINEKYDQKFDECRQVVAQYESCEELITSLRAQLEAAASTGSSFTHESSPQKSSVTSPPASSFAEITGQDLDADQESERDIESAAKQEKDQQMRDALEEIAILKDQIQDTLTCSDYREQQLKSYIKCLESDLQEARVQLAITRSISRASGDAEEKDMVDAESALEPCTSGLPSPVTSHEPLTSDSQIQELQYKLSQSLDERQVLEDQVKGMKEDLENFRCQTKITSTCAIVPLIMLLVAILIAFYPTVSTVTGTTDS